MWILSIITAIVGSYACYLGYNIKNKGRIDLIHSYHYEKVSKEDEKAYTSLMGIAQYIIGLGLITTSILGFFTETWWVVLTIIIPITTGFIIIHIAQKKYNNGWF